MRAYGIGADGVPPLDVQPAMNSFLTPFDTAVTLVFHHPEIMNLDPAQGTSILNLIQTAPCTSANPDCMPFIDTLAFRIASNWPATTTPGGWATLVPMTDANGNPVFGDDGEQLYRYDLADDTVAAPRPQCARSSPPSSTTRNTPASIGTPPRGRQ